MTQPFTDALTWVPKSRALAATLGRAHDLARAQGHESVSLEHLLLSLIEDPDASSVLLSCNIDLLSLNSLVSTEVQRIPVGTGGLPNAAPALVTILEYAVAAARQSRRSEINGAIVLAAIVGEGKSEAARLLHALGLKFEDAVLALRRAAASKPPAGAPSEAVTATIPAAAAPVGMSVDAVPPASMQTGAAASGEARAAQDAAAAAVNGHHTIDEDPITTARRRVEALRSGPTLSNGAHAQPQQAAASSTAAPTQENRSPPSQAPPPLPAAQLEAAPPTPSAASDWAPPPVQPPSPSRPPRMPPPVPPIPSQPPLRPTASTAASTDPTGVAAPWRDAGARDVGLEAAVPNSQPIGNASQSGPPIEVGRLVERLPQRMPARVASTVEIRLSRAAVMATAAAAGGGGEIVLTRALSVRLKAPAGGFHIENAAPETQWFDTRTSQRGDNEVRWRWQVTPHSSGRHPLQLSISMRTIAADGMMIETMLPEHQTTVRVGPHLPSLAKTCAALVAAALAGGFLALLASGEWVGVLARLIG